MKAIDYFRVWEHVFLVEECIEGETLAKWIARNYPFSRENNVKQYLEAVKKIILSVRDIIVEMHKCDVAMCDLQTQNIMVDEYGNVNLIDFEISSSCSSCEDVGMETKGFTHPLNKLARDKDWYALSRILSYCVLPIGPVTDLCSDMYKKHCLWIRQNFGREFFEFYIKIQKEICEYITNRDKIFGKIYDAEYLVPEEQINISDIILKLKRGLLSNCNKQKDALINGDIRQYETDCGKYNLLYGGFGAVWALKQNGELPEEITDWINEKIPVILDGNYNSGLMTGKAGIALVLCKAGYMEESVKLIRKVMDSYKSIENDISFRSGLAGIGIALLSFYKTVGEEKFIENAERIAVLIKEKIENNVIFKLFDWDSVEIGFMDGFSGVSILFTLLYEVTKKEKYRAYAEQLIRKDIENMEFIPEDGSMQAYDKSRNRFLPYLANGSIGVGSAISLFHRISGQAQFKGELTAIVKANNFRCCYDAGLLDGAGGFALLSCISKEESMKKTLERMQIFMVEDEEKILIPGKFSYRFSSDIYSGVSGIILSLQAALEKKILGWLPINI